MDALSFLLAPFVASLILAGIHAYLGVHVVERQDHERPLLRVNPLHEPFQELQRDLRIA